MTALGYIVMAVGVAGLLLKITGADAAFVPGLARISIAIWAGIAIAGALVAILTRRPSD